MNMTNVAKNMPFYLAYLKLYYSFEPMNSLLNKIRTSIPGWFLRQPRR